MTKRRPSKIEVKAVLTDDSIEDIPDGAYWCLVHERLGMEYGDVFDYIAEDPEYYGYGQATPVKEE